MATTSPHIPTSSSSKEKATAQAQASPIDITVSNKHSQASAQSGIMPSPTDSAFSNGDAAQISDENNNHPKTAGLPLTSQPLKSSTHLSPPKDTKKATRLAPQHVSAVTKTKPAITIDELRSRTNGSPGPQTRITRDMYDAAKRVVRTPSTAESEPPSREGVDSQEEHAKEGDKGKKPIRGKTQKRAVFKSWVSRVRARFSRNKGDATPEPSFVARTESIPTPVTEQDTQLSQTYIPVPDTSSGADKGLLEDVRTTLRDSGKDFLSMGEESALSTEEPSEPTKTSEHSPRQSNEHSNQEESPTRSPSSPAQISPRLRGQSRFIEHIEDDESSILPLSLTPPNIIVSESSVQPQDTRSNTSTSETQDQAQNSRRSSIILERSSSSSSDLETRNGNERPQLRSFSSLPTKYTHTFPTAQTPQRACSAPLLHTIPEEPAPFLTPAEREDRGRTRERKKVSSKKSLSSLFDSERRGRSGRSGRRMERGGLGLGSWKVSFSMWESGRVVGR